jgi:hypothetical protein
MVQQNLVEVTYDRPGKVVLCMELSDFVPGQVFVLPFRLTVNTSQYPYFLWALNDSNINILRGREYLVELLSIFSIVTKLLHFDHHSDLQS